MDKPQTDRPLTAGDVHLLREGDVLRVVDYCSGGPAIGSEVEFHHATSDSIWLGPDEDSDDDGWAFNRFTFVARPATSAASEVEGADIERLCGALLDGPGCTPWSASSWDSDGTDGASREGVRESVRRVLAALASPPSERERELEGALRLAANRMDRLALEVQFDTRLRAEAAEWVAEARALTAQPAGEPTHG